MVASSRWVLASLLLVACGGTAIIDEGAGGSTSVTAGSGGSATSSTAAGGSPPSASCSGAADCCAAICDYAAAKGCGMDPCECGVIDGTPSCEAAYDALLLCVVDDLTSAVICSADGSVALLCGYCDAERQQFEQACGGEVECDLI